MNKLQKKIGSIIILFLLIISIEPKTFAKNSNGEIGEIDYSSQYLEWLKLDKETKEKYLMPRIYNVYANDETIYNPIKNVKLLSSTITSKFNLKDYISNNMVIKNQGELGSCWAFSSLADLEINLALKDYYNNQTQKKYDFSERHLEYSTTKTFLNNQINENGFNRKVGDGGNTAFSSAYLTNGMGAINEEDMPYVDSDELMDISQIQNKTVTSQVYDITEFPTDSTTDINELKQKMKEHIKNYGGIEASIHEDQTECLNYKTGASYCTNSSHPINHAVLIVGWDDDYSIDNFYADCKPKANGAWIAKDSHGTDEDGKYTFTEFKEMIFKQQKTTFEQNGITSADQISDELVKKYVETYQNAGFSIEDGKVCLKHNDNGYIYISYEDSLVYTALSGITKAENTLNYDNIYQYNYLGTNGNLSIYSDKIYLANAFEKKTNNVEYLNQIAISTPETVTCKVYVNPNGTSKNNDDLKQVQLKQGDSLTIDAGYHTLEFLNPIKIEGTAYVVAIELQGKRSGNIGVSIETDYPAFYKKIYGAELSSDNIYNAYKDVKIENGKCFFATEEDFSKNEWSDLSDLYNLSNGKLPDSDSTIKAFTVSSLKENNIKEIKISTPPSKTTYNEGENFESNGMVIEAIYQDETKKEITDYKIEDGTNLKADQTEVTIYYNGLTVKQKISVNKTKEEIVNAKNSDFSNSKLKVNTIKCYMFDSVSEEYITMGVTLSDILKNTSNDGYKYYYYLSKNQNEEKIEKWVEIKNGNISDNKLEFEINTKDISNYVEISKAENLYLYIKEVVTKGENEAQITTNAIKMETDVTPEIYFNNKKIDIEENEKDNKNTEKSDNKQIQGNSDTTKAPSILPHTGAGKIIFVFIILVIIGIIGYIKYKNISKYVK